jgi:hypothetical protein
MKRRVTISAFAVLLSLPFLQAQRVLYSPFIDDRYLSRFEVAGKTLDYYWMLREPRQRSKYFSGIEQGFDVYDTRLKTISHIQNFMIPANASKEYLIAGKEYFDKMLLLQNGNSTNITVQRFLQDGSQYSPNKTIGNLPFNEQGNSFLLIRSEDKSKIMLLCFESVPSSSPNLHAILFNENWERLSYKIFRHPFITQPFIQDDFTSYPIEYFCNQPVKLANNGQWLMAAPSRTNNNFLLFHFCDDGNDFSYKEIALPTSTELDDVALTINNEKGDAFAGLLSKFHYPTLKNVEVVHYSMIKQQFDFDSSYRFNTLPGNKLKNDNLVHESFVSVPGSGFLLLKEYGRTFTSSFEDDGWNPATFFVNSAAANEIIPAYTNNDGYTKFNKLTSAANTYQRGDLSLFYFPAQKTDSCWSGFISKEQNTEMNSPNLSYVLFPARDKLALLYNSFFKNEEQYGSSIFLDKQGNLINNGGVAFWKFNIDLNFQQAKQINGSEIAVPYKDNQRLGFAIIRF